MIKIGKNRLNRHGRNQTCLCVNASACAPTHLPVRRQDIPATHGYKNRTWFFDTFLRVFTVNGDENGFTLIEILIAMTIFAIGMLAIGAMQISAIRENAFSNDLTEASTIAQDQVELLISKDFSDPDLVDVNGDGTAGIDNPNRTTVITGGNALLSVGGAGQADHGQVMNVQGLNYMVYWNIADLSSFAKQIRVIVAWNNKGMHRIAMDYIKNR